MHTSYLYPLRLRGGYICYIIKPVPTYVVKTKHAWGQAFFMGFLLFLSDFMVPLIIFYIVGFAILGKRPVFDDFLYGLPGPIIPIAFIRLVSNSAAVGLVLDLFKNYGPDSQVGLMVSILMGSTETVLYCMSVYFGSAGISRTRYTLAGGLLAAFVSLAASVVLANQLAL